ncbi:unnamed protein product, partial [Allacma fusca]
LILQPEIRHCNDTTMLMANFATRPEQLLAGLSPIDVPR